MKANFKNGQTVRDKISGFEGTILGVAKYYNGCIRYQIQPKVKTDGGFRDAEWIDEEQIEKVKSKSILTPKTKHGGDRPNPNSGML